MLQDLFMMNKTVKKVIMWPIGVVVGVALYISTRLLLLQECFEGEEEKEDNENTHQNRRLPQR